MDEWIKTVWYIHTMESYSTLKKEENPAICNNTDGPGGHYVKWNIRQAQKTNTISSHLYEESETHRSRVEWWWPAAGGEGKGEVMVKG